MSVDIRRTTESVSSLTQGHHVEDQPEPVLEPTLNAEPVTKTTTDLEHTVHQEYVVPEPTRPSDTPILDSTPTEPNILHIFDDA